MTQYGPTAFEGPNESEIRVAPGPQYAVCRQCVKRIKLPAEVPAGFPIEQLSCECGARLRPYDPPVELTTPARGVLPRLIKFWKAGREDGYWDEKRFFRPAAAERAGVAPRQVRFAYDSGRRAGERIRQDAHLHAMRVMKMKGASAAPPRAA